MKKLMTSTIILLPLIILAILLVSGAIKALTTHIYVDRVEFVDDDTLVLVMDDEENPPDEKLEVNVLPLKADNRGLIFSIDDDSIATVDKDGNVVAKYYGETYVNVMSAEDNLKTDRRRVLVTDEHVHKIEITADCPTDVYEAKREQLAAVIYPQEATERGIKWTSSDPDILEISSTGIIEAKGAGEVTVTATSAEREGISDSVTITCHSAIDEIKTEVKRVETALETANFPNIIQDPLDADITIAYTSDDPDIATVDENGLITFSKAGKVTITATATDFGSTTTSTSIEYVSTLHYYRLPLFEKKAYTVDFDEYYLAGRALEIPFAAGFKPEDTNRRVTDVKYSIPDVLTFDAAKEEFCFIGEMPDGTSDITVTVTAEVYDTETNELTAKEDAFTLTVQRKAQSIAVGYNGTKDAQSIVLSENTLIFGTDSNATAPISVFPTNHTDKLYYTLENAEESLAKINGGTLTFKKAGSVDVLVSCKYENGEEHVRSRIKVSYAPVSEREHTTGVVIKPAEEGQQQPAKQQVLLSMEGDTKEEGILYFAEPADSTVTYAVVDEENAAVELTEENGAQHIVPKKGGFATIEITVSPKPAAAIALFSAPRSGEPDGATVYTVEIYVDKLVSAEDLSVQLNGKPATGARFGATGTSVSYQFDVDEKQSAMAGKALYVTYSSLSASDDGAADSKTMSGSISFPAEKQQLEVTFGVKYTAKALELGAKDTLPTVKRTITRNADSLAFQYRGTNVSAITTTSATLAFTTEGDPSDEGKVYVMIGPDNHTDTVAYSLVGEKSGARLNGGTLSFTDPAKPCSVTVQVQLRGLDGEISLTETIEVSYAPQDEWDTVVKLPSESGKKLLLSMTDIVKIDYVVPAGATVECTAQNGAVKTEQIGTVWTVTPLKGGLDTVTFTVKGGNADATYTIDVYVDRPVRNNFTVKLGGEEHTAGTFSTTLQKVPFEISIACTEGAMGGKQLYVQYGETTLTGAEGATTFTGEIDFTALATLEVTFGVQYADSAVAYSPTGDLPAITRTITRNADSVTFQYRGTAVDAVTTTSSTLTFKTSDTTKESEVYVKIGPDNHTDTVAYSLVEDHSDGAEIMGQGALTFTDTGKPCAVTVQIRLTGKDGKVSLTKEIVVTYAPRNGAKVVTLPNGNGTKLLLSMTDTVKIDYVVPAGATATCEATESGVVQVEEQNTVWTITPQKGGFDTVTFTVSNAGDADATYTIDIYVDRTVQNNFTVELGGKEVSAQYYSTKENAVSFTVKVNCAEDAMAGKQLYVKYGETTLTGEAGATTFTGDAKTIDFTGLATLPVTFGVQYADSAKDYGKTGEIGGVYTTRTIARRAEGVTFSYNGTEVAEVTTSNISLTFTTDVVPAADKVNMTVTPANHTDTVKYSVKAGAAKFGGNDGNVLTFDNTAEACEVTVQLDFRGADGTSSFTKEIVVKYAPYNAADKQITLPGAEKTPLLLFMSDAGTADKAKINYDVPAGAEVECTAKNNVVDVKYEDNKWTITPLKGGFDTVTVAVTGGSADATYTINVYVDHTVSKEDFTVKFDDQEYAAGVAYYTTKKSVSFTVTVDNTNGEMAGKQIYVNYNNGQNKRLTGNANAITFSDTIDFPGTSGKLSVTFGVEYAADTQDYSPKGGLQSVERTLERNAETITVTYGGVATAKIVTKEAAIDFNGKVTVAPAAHTDKDLAYVLEGGAGIATMEGSKLTFQNAGTVTVKVQTKRGETVTLTKPITVTYEPVGDGNTEIALDKTEQKIVLSYTSMQQALIYFTEKEGTTVTYKIEGETSAVIDLQRKNGSGNGDTGIYHIVPKQGGFAAVKVTVSEGAGPATEYTVNVYVDAPVNSGNISVQFEETPVTNVYGTTLESVRFKVTVNCEKDAMQGKQIYVKYGSGNTKLTGNADSTTFSGAIDFKDLAKLAVNIGVEYAENVSAYSLSGEIPTVLASRTLERNAESITVTYNNVQTSKIVTKDNTITFGEEVGKSAKIKIEPTAHTDTLAYDYSGDTKIAMFTGSTLTFKEAGTVKLTLKTVRGGNAIVTKEITVTYEPFDRSKQTEITLGAQTESKYIVMSLGSAQKEGVIYYTVPEGATVTYDVSGEAVSGGYQHGADETYGVYHIAPQKGGFATVTVTVKGGGADATHTFNIYVNAPVSDNFTVKFDGTEYTENTPYGTEETTVSFEITVNCEESAMAGKQIYVKYNNGQSQRLTATAGLTTYSGTIELGDSIDSLTVTFGVEYAADMKGNYKLNGIAFGAITTRTLGQNPKNISVKYGGVETEKIVTHESTINLQTDVVIGVEPEIFSIDYAYELKGNGIATIEDSELKFTGSGTVSLIIKTVRDGVETCSKTITVTYEDLGDNKEIKLDSDTQNVVLKYGSEEGLIYFTVPKDVTNITYTLTNTNSKSPAIDETLTKFEFGADETSGVYHIVPKQGGFATLTVTVEGGGKDATYTINIYVDAPVSLSDLTVKFNSVVYAEEGATFKTSQTSVSYTFQVTNNNSAVEGKEVHVEINNAAHGAPLAWNHFAQSTKFTFDPEKTEYTFIFTVQYTADVAAYGLEGMIRTVEGSYARTTRTVVTTMGRLATAPKVTYDGGELQTDGNATAFTLKDIGDKIIFTVDKESFDPADYQLSSIVLTNLSDGVKYIEFSPSGSTFSLTAKKCTDGQAIKYTVNIGQHIFNLMITVQAKAQEIQVTYGKTVLGDGQHYKTLLDSLMFTVKAIRHDSETITDPALEYNDGSGWKPFEPKDGQYTLSGLVLDEKAKEVREVQFRAKDGSGVSFTLLVERVQLTDFSMEVGVYFNDGKPPVVIGRTKSVADVGGSLEYVLPARMSGTLALYIVADKEYLGGFGSREQFKAVIPAEWQSVDWEIDHTLLSMGTDTLPHADINLTLPSGMKDPASLEIGGGDYCVPQCTITFRPTTSTIAWIEFPGFDGNNSADVYKGYQQVRVFAKKSDYGDGKLVDYYRIPVAAYAEVKDMQVNEETGKRNPMTNLSGLTWKLTSYTDNAKTEGGIVVEQTGTTVNYTQKQTTTTYNIVKAENGTVTLQLQSQEGATTTIVKADGTYADGQPHVPWVDTVSEAAEGYVRVYFGDFVGLSESDVQNDFFGNFGEEEEWSKSYKEGQKDIKGGTVTPSGGAFSFLRLEGGDGVANAHFNFNVLQDAQDANLVNVFNANGYYAHSQVVLQENLYGPDEDPSAPEAQIIRSTTVSQLNKTTIYGNGYQINLKAKNDALVEILKQSENTGRDGITMQWLYNVTLKGTDPAESVSCATHKIILNVIGAYYSDLQSYSKLDPIKQTDADGTRVDRIFFKNTVMRYVANCALQLWTDATQGTPWETKREAYFENVVITECMRAISIENGTDNNLYIRGFFDVLNYSNCKGLQDKFQRVNGGTFYYYYFTEQGTGQVPGLTTLAPNIVEWFGKNGTVGKTDNRYFVNMIFTTSSKSVQAKSEIKVWDDKTSAYSGDAELVNKYNLVDLTVGSGSMGVTLQTFNVPNTTDGGKEGFASRDMGQLFTEDRDIRLLCEYKTINDTTLVKNTEHVVWHMQKVYRDLSLAGKREGHIENLKRTLDGVKWPDGTSAADAGVTAAIALNELLSETVIPSKSAY